MDFGRSCPLLSIAGIHFGSFTLVGQGCGLFTSPNHSCSYLHFCLCGGRRPRPLVSFGLRVNKKAGVYCMKLLLAGHGVFLVQL